MTKIKIKMPFFGGKYFEIVDLQPLIPYTILSIVQDGFEFVMEIQETITKEQVDAVVANMRAYVVANLITAEII